jgi:hypothetical protein
MTPGIMYWDGKRVTRRTWHPVIAAHRLELEDGTSVLVTKEALAASRDFSALGTRSSNANSFTLNTNTVRVDGWGGSTPADAEVEESTSTPAPVDEGRYLEECLF